MCGCAFERVARGVPAPAADVENRVCTRSLPLELSTVIHGKLVLVAGYGHIYIYFKLFVVFGFGWG